MRPAPELETAIGEHSNAPKVLLLGEKELPRKIHHWTDSPRPVETPVYIHILNNTFDILLLSCSKRLLDSTKFVSIIAQ